MLKELIALEIGKPVLREYEDGPVPEGHIRVMVEYGAPKHGSEQAMLQGMDPHLSNRFDREYLAFIEDESIANRPFNVRLGNMWVGRIAEIGKGVQGFKENQRVAGYGHLRNTHTIKAESALIMKESMTWQEAVCYDPAQFALGGIRDGHVRMGDRVAVFGLGAIGQMAAQMAKKAGASFVAVVDPIEKRRNVALKCGADMAIDPSKEDVGLALKNATRKKGVDAAIETSGYYAAMHQAIRGLAYGGNIAVVGWYYKEYSKEMLNFGMEAHFNYPNIIFSRACSEPNRDHPRWDFKRIMDTCWDMLSGGAFQCQEILDPVVPFAEVVPAYIDIEKHPERSVKLGVRF